MQGYYIVTETLKAQLEADRFVNTVNTGIIQDVLLRKADMYPYSHILTNNSTYTGNTWVFNMSVICMDIVDLSKDETTDIFLGNDNQQDVLNTQLAVINRMLEVLMRGSNTKSYIIEGTPNCEPFIDRFEHGVAGWTVTFDIRIPNTMTVCDSEVTPVKLCPDFVYSITDASENVLYSGTKLSGQSLTQIISSSTVTNTLGTVLATILAQGTAQLADVNNTDSDGSTVPTPAGVPFVCTPVAPCANGTVNVNKSDGALISAVSVASGGTEPYNVADSTAVVKDSAGTILSTTAIKATESTDIAVGNNTVTLNGGAFLTLKAEENVNVQLVNQSDVPIVPDSVVGAKITVTTGGTVQGLTLMKTGQTTQRVPFDDGAIEMGRLTDHVTLNYNNPFGNTKRFTDKTDAGTFANSVAYDWSTWNESDGKVLAYYFGDFSYRSKADHCALHVASTIDGLANDWYLWNFIQMMNIVNSELLGNFVLNYPPFNLGTRYYHLSSGPDITWGACATDLAGLGFLFAAAPANTYFGLFVRECTVVGTTIT